MVGETELLNINFKKPTIENSFFLQYLNEIRKGNIVVCQRLYRELENLERDLNNHRWYYDTRLANVFINCIEGFFKHTKSPFYGEPVKLMLFQKAVIELMFSFKEKETGFDRFTYVLLLIGRKNGKTTLNAWIALCYLLIYKGGIDIFTASNDERQSGLTFDEMKRTAQLFDPEEQYLHKNLRNIENIKNFSKVSKMSSKQKNIEGFNIDFAILDESNMLADDTLPNSLLQSMSIKKNPKLINITTQGFVNDGYLDKTLDLCYRVIDGEEPEATHILPLLYEQDSEQEIYRDPKTWMKSNPTLGEVKTYDYLKKRLLEAQNDKASRLFTLCKDFNIKQNNAEAWLAPEDYDYPQDIHTLEEFKGCVAIGAVDLSETTDLTCAKLMVFKKGDNTKYVFTKYFIPEYKITSDSNAMNDINAGAKYKEWAQEGFVKVSEGTDIDLVEVAQWFNDIQKRYALKIICIGYDQRFSKPFLEAVRAECEMVYQNKKTLSNAMKLTERELKARLINYGNNPVDKWNLGNASIEVDNFGDCQAVKVKNNHSMRIDGAVTLIILYEIYRRKRLDINKLVNR